MRSARALWRKQEVGALEKALRIMVEGKGVSYEVLLLNYIPTERSHEKERRHPFQARTSVPDHTQDAGVGPEAKCIAARLVLYLHFLELRFGVTFLAILQGFFWHSSRRHVWTNCKGAKRRCVLCHPGALRKLMGKEQVRGPHQDIVGWHHGRRK